MKNKWIRLLVLLIAAGIAVFLLIQLVPYGHNLTKNPPVVSEPAWDSPQTRELAKRACFDCHSNETSHPWYAYVAPSSWLLQWDVDHARSTYNFSDWQNYPTTATLIIEIVGSGRMPPGRYLLMHPEARLSAAEKQQLFDGLKKSLGE
jgi:hypothetical protein